MSFIERIKRNVAQAILIKKIANEKYVDYYTAKIMYHNGKNDIDSYTAEAIKDTFKDLEIPSRMIDAFDLVDEYQDNKNSLDTYDLYLKIAKKINRDKINDLSPYIYADYYYGDKIFNLMKKGISFKAARRIFEIKLRYEMRVNRLSETAALAKILSFENNRLAKIFEQEYLAGRAVKYDDVKTIKKGILNSPDLKITHVHVGGKPCLTLVSDSDTGLEKLVRLVNNAYKNGDKKFLNVFSKYASNNDLFITNVKISTTKASYYSGYYNLIYINEKEKDEDEALITFYHESTHFIDNVREKKNAKKFFYSADSPEIINLFEKMKKISHPWKRGLSLSFRSRSNAKKYVNNPELIQKWTDEIKASMPNISDEDLKLLLTQKKNYKRKKAKIICASICDIYDSMTNGKLYSFGLDGHGKKYYKDYENVLGEFIANIGLIYDAGEMDFLRYEFGDLLTNDINQVYENFLFNNKSKKNPTR